MTLVIYDVSKLSLLILSRICRPKANQPDSLISPNFLYVSFLSLFLQGTNSRVSERRMSHLAHLGTEIFTHLGTTLKDRDINTLVVLFSIQLSSDGGERIILEHVER